jgi:hypothetical protein
VIKDLPQILPDGIPDLPPPFPIIGIEDEAMGAHNAEPAGAVGYAHQRPFVRGKQRHQVPEAASCGGIGALFPLAGEKENDCEKQEDGSGHGLRLRSGHS